MAGAESENGSMTIKRKQYPPNADGTINLPLTKGYVATIDADDADLAQLLWKTDIKEDGRPYAARSVNNSSVMLHRTILGRMLNRELLRSDLVDHVDGNGL